MLIDVLLLGSLTYLCTSTSSEQTLHVFTSGILVTCITSFLRSLEGNDETENVGSNCAMEWTSWDWFSWAKRLSLLLGWASLVFAWQNGKKGGVYGSRIVQVKIAIYHALTCTESFFVELHI